MTDLNLIEARQVVKGQPNAQQTVISKSIVEEKINKLLKTNNILSLLRLPLGYRELLDISFYDLDFLGTTIKDVYLGSIFRSREINWNGSLPAEVTDSNVGNVSYTVDNIPHRTTAGNWNAVFKDNVPNGFTKYPL